MKKLYIDMDGTIVDFVSQISTYGYWRKNKPNKVQWDKVIKQGPKFWDEMDWMPGAEEAFKELQRMDKEGAFELYILTSIDFDEGREGKKFWIKSHTDFPLEKVIFVQEPEDKANYADANSILIDDRNKSLKPFEEAGGYSIRFSSWDWKLELEKVKILTTGLEIKTCTTQEKIKNGEKEYCLVEKISKDNLRIIEINNKTEGKIEFAIIHLPYFCEIYEEIAKKYKDLGTNTVIAGIEDLSKKDEDYIFCGTPYRQYEGRVGSAIYIDISTLLWNTSFEELVQSCFSTLIGDRVSENSTQISDIKKDYRKNDRTNTHFIAGHGKSITELKTQFEKFLADYESDLGDSIEHLICKEVLLTIISNNAVFDKDEIKLFEESISQRLKKTVCIYTMRVNTDVCDGYCYQLFFNADDNYDFWMF